MSSSPARGLLFVVSAPSGTGKTTLVERLVACCPDVKQSRSYTSRPARPGEQQGVDYNFVSRDVFETMLRGGQFLESASIFGDLYGTCRADTERDLATGVDLILVIDVQGAKAVRQQLPDAVGIFVLPPSFEALEARLRGRNKDSEAAIRVRLDTARREIDAVEDYTYVVINDDVERCVRELRAIILAERARLGRKRAVVERVVATFRQ